MIPLTDTVAQYTNLLLAQYKSGVRARETIAILVKQALGDMLASTLADCFDLDSAVGPQLDTLGKYIGIPRTIGDPVSQPYYGLWDMTQASSALQNPNGFTDYTSEAVNAQAIWFQYQFTGAQNTALSDVAYALMLKLQVILNANDGTLASIQDYLHTFLPGLVSLVDNCDMTMTYTLSSSIPVSPNVLKAYLPKPMGVLLNFLTLTATLSTHTLNAVTRGIGTLTATSGSVTATPANGTPAYHYAWQLVAIVSSTLSSGTTVNIVTPTAAATTFSLLGNVPLSTSPDQTIVATYRCVVTDSKGIVANSELVTVTLTIGPPP